MFPLRDRIVVGWRAWYTGGLRYSSAEWRWEDLPPNGILAVVAYERTRPYRRILSGASLYWRNADGSFGQWGYSPSVVDDPPEFDGCVVKGGDWTTTAEWERVLGEAMDAHEAPDECMRVDGG